jgi:uncharacterized protein (DUF983 family)
MTRERPPSTLRDGNEHLGLEMPAARRLLRLLGRAARLRCPACGGGPVMARWLKMRSACGACGQQIERGEADYFIGSMLLNLVLAELAFAVVFTATLVVLWPRVPWGLIQVLAVVGVGLAPFVFFPFSKLVWLATDLAFRPSRGRDPTS